MKDPSKGEIAAWVAALLLWVVGDIVTTYIGMMTPGVVEMNALYVYPDIVGMALVKLPFLVGALGAWALFPTPHRAGIPIGLAMLGAVAVGWNIATLMAV